MYDVLPIFYASKWQKKERRKTSSSSLDYWRIAEEKKTRAEELNSCDEKVENVIVGYVMWIEKKRALLQ